MDIQGQTSYFLRILALAAPPAGDDVDFRAGAALLELDLQRGEKKVLDRGDDLVAHRAHELIIRKARVVLLEKLAQVCILADGEAALAGLRGERRFADGELLRAGCTPGDGDAPCEH